MIDVTIVVVFQDSMPWLDVHLAAQRQFKNEARIRHIFVKNLPSRDSGPRRVEEFVASLPNPADHLLMQTYPPAFADGRAHAHGLSVAFPEVATEWCMFMDADAIPIGDHWLDKMLAMGGDMVGFEPDSGVDNPKLPTLHPCMLLFKTELARPPYWSREQSKADQNPYFGQWAHELCPDGSNQWDVCRPWTYTIGMNPACKQIRMRNIYSVSKDSTPYFRLQNGDELLGLHVREGSKRWARGVLGTNLSRWQLWKVLPELAWYREPEMTEGEKN